MGPRVLDLAVTSSSNVSASLHAYAHCHPSNNGSVSIAFINIDPATSYTYVTSCLLLSVFVQLIASCRVDLSKYGATAEVYLFDGADVTSQVPTLNGQLLDVSGVEVSQPKPSWSGPTRRDSLALGARPDRQDDEHIVAGVTSLVVWVCHPGCRPRALLLTCCSDSRIDRSPALRVFRRSSSIALLSSTNIGGCREQGCRTTLDFFVRTSRWLA
jgi:hypothetical protein